MERAVNSKFSSKKGTTSFTQSNLFLKFRRFFLFALLSIICAQAAFSEKISIYSIDKSQFPEMSAEIYVFDDDGKQMTDLDTSEFRIFEDGLERWNKDISCPSGGKTNPISSALTIDVSHSMMDGGRMQLAKDAALSWVNAISHPQSECAITSFDAFSYINQSFTRDKDSLRAAINDLQPRSGTNYQAAFLSDSGAIPLTAKGDFQKIIVFLTDGEPDESYPPNPKEIIAEARARNITIFCVALGMPATSILNEIADSTGGECYGNVKTRDEAELIYLTILQNIEGIQPCTISWNSDLNCGQHRDVIIGMPDYYIEARSYYYVEKDQLPHLIVTAENNFDFGRVDSGETDKTEIKVSAKLKDIKIRTLTYDNPEFSIMNNISGSFILARNETIEFEVQFSPDDTCRQRCNFTIPGEACSGKYFTMFGGVECQEDPDTMEPKPRPPLRLVKPNGGEELTAGGFYAIEWKDVKADEEIQLEYSSDGGNNWNLISDNAQNLQYNWKAPNVSSDECLMKIRNTGNNAGVVDSSAVFGMGSLAAVDISPDGEYLATVSNFGTVYIWNAHTGSIIKEFNERNSVVPEIRWNKIGQLAAGYDNNNIKIYDIRNNEEYVIATELDGALTALSWNADNKRLACADNRGKINVIDVYYQFVSREMKEYSSGIKSLSWDPTGFNIVSGHNDGAVLIWDLSMGNPIIKPLGYHSGLASAVAWSPAGDIIASGGVDQRIVLHKINGDIIKSVTAHKGRITTLSWSDDGSQIISGSDDDIVKKWSSQGVELAKYSFHNGDILRVRNLANGRFLSGGGDNNIFIYDSVQNQITKRFEGHQNGITSVVWNPKTPYYVATASGTGKCYVWNVAKRKVAQTLSAGALKTIRLAYNYQASRIAGGCEDGSIIIWNPISETITNIIKHPAAHKKKIMGLSWGPNGIKLATVGADSSLKVFDGGSGSLLHSIELNQGTAFSIDWNRNNDYIACAMEDGAINVYNGNNYRLESSVYETEDSVITLKWSKDGDSLVAGASGGEILLFDASFPRSPSLIKKFSEEYLRRALSWNNSTGTMASGGLAHGIRFWDGEYGFVSHNLQCEVESRNRSVEEVAFSNDGDRILAGTTVGSLHMFYLNETPKLIQRDTSDAYWEIIKPLVISKDVEMGDAEVNSQFTKTIYGFLSNLSKVPVNVDSIYFEGNGSGDFELDFQEAPFTMEPFQVMSSTFTFSPSSAGEKTATFTIITQSDTLTHVVSGRGLQEGIETYEIDFGFVEVGTSKDSTDILIKNIGQKAIRVNSFSEAGPDPDQFDVSRTFSSFDLEPNEDYPYKLTFSPTKIGQARCEVEFYLGSESEPAVAILKGNGSYIKPRISVTHKDTVKLICDAIGYDTLFVHNLGKETLNINSVALLENSDGAFEIVKNLQSTQINGGSQSEIIINFEPPGESVYQSRLNIQSNSTNESSSLDIVLTGIYAPFNIQRNPATLQISRVCSGDTILSEIEITNDNEVNTNVFCYSHSELIEVTPDSADMLSGESEYIYAETIIPKSVKDTVLEIYIQNDICGTIDTVKVNISSFQPDLKLSGTSISSYLGASDEGKIRLSNFSEESLQIDSIKVLDDAPFEIINFSPVLTIKGNKSEQIDVRFTPKDTLPIEATIAVFGSPCEFVRYIVVNGDPMKFPLTISADTVKAEPGEIATIPIRLINEMDVEIEQDAYIETNLTFDKNLLYPIEEYEENYIDGNKRTIKINKPISLNGGDIIARARFKAMLGGIESSSLELRNSKITKGFFDISESPGFFILDGLCKEGGIRLIEKKGASSNLQIIPNPSSEKAEIIFEPILQKDDYIRLDIYDVYGTRTKSVKEKAQDEKSYKTEIDLEEFNSGTYFIILRINNKTFTKSFSVIK